MLMVLFSNEVSLVTASPDQAPSQTERSSQASGRSPSCLSRRCVWALVVSRDSRARRDVRARDGTIRLDSRDLCVKSCRDGVSTGGIRCCRVHVEPQERRHSIAAARAH